MLNKRHFLNMRVWILGNKKAHISMSLITPTNALRADNKKYSKIHSRIDSRLSAKNRPSPFFSFGQDEYIIS